MTYREWEQQVPSEITADLVWRQRVYRLATFASDIGWSDVTRLMADRRTLRMSDQLYRALGSIGANFAEGYSRSSGRDRVRFFEYSLGSAREARDWYYRGRHILGEQVTNHRLDLCAQMIRLLLTMLPTERARTIQEESISYTVPGDEWMTVEIPF